MRVGIIKIFINYNFIIHIINNNYLLKINTIDKIIKKIKSSKNDNNGKYLLRDLFLFYNIMI